MNFNEKIAWDEAISDRKQMEISGLKSNPAEGNPDVLVGSMFSISQQCPLATKTKNNNNNNNNNKNTFLSKLKTVLSSWLKEVIITPVCCTEL